jgi:hypothetical protein
MSDDLPNEIHIDTSPRPASSVLKYPKKVSPKRNSTQPIRDLIGCWECRQPVGQTAKICPYCGADQGMRPTTTPAWAFVAALITVASVFAMIYFGITRQLNQDRELRQLEAELQREHGNK